jgi:hypothetical protein
LCALIVAASEGPYKDYLHRRWNEGERNVTHLVAELRGQGYRGSDTIIFDYLRPLHQQPEWLPAYLQQQQRAAQGMPTAPLSAREAAWLFVCPPPKLTLAQVRQLDPLRTRDEELGKAYELVQDFRTMVTRRQLALLHGGSRKPKPVDCRNSVALRMGYFGTMMRCARRSLSNRV